MIALLQIEPTTDLAAALPSWVIAIVVVAVGAYQLWSKILAPWMDSKRARRTTTPSTPVVDVALVREETARTIRADIRDAQNSEILRELAKVMPTMAEMDARICDVLEKIEAHLSDARRAETITGARVERIERDVLALRHHREAGGE